MPVRYFLASIRGKYSAVLSNCQIGLVRCTIGGMDARISPALEPLGAAYVQTVRAALPEIVYGVYLYGSAALDAFDPARSDVDFMTVLQRPLTAHELCTLCRQHERLRATQPLADVWKDTTACCQTYSKLCARVLTRPSLMGDIWAKAS